MDPSIFRATNAPIIGILHKDPTERPPVVIDMTNAVPAGTILSAATYVVTDVADGLTVTGIVLPEAINGLRVPLTVAAGVNQHRYKIAATIRDTTGHIYRKILFVQVRAT